MLVGRLAEVWEALRATRSRLKKVELVSELLADAAIDDVPLVVAYLSGEIPQGKIGLGYASVGSVDVPAADETTITVGLVSSTLDAIKDATGPGSKKAKQDLLGDLLSKATAPEQEFITRLLLGGLRQGALEALMAEAVAKTAEIPVGLVRRAAMVTGDLPLVATAAMNGGQDALTEFGLELFTAVQPMLAQSAESVAAALDKTGDAAGVEWKVDGARVQVHRSGAKIKVYTRNLRDITTSVPDLVRAVAACDLDSIILDGEAIASDTAGRPVPFQETMSRFSSDADGALDVKFFDCLHLNGIDLLDESGATRWAAMEQALPEHLLIKRIVPTSTAQAQTFFDAAIESGNEGVMVKALDAPYAAGRRGAAWVKVKPVHTLDLVVLAVEWGSGRRSGWLSNIHLGARDPDAETFVMLGKTFKGMTDDMLRWQTERFLELETHRDGHIVHVRPEQVVEVAIDGVQRSSRYPGGVALRFARVKAYRDDKAASDADTIDRVRELR